jgi:hypothetical protein
LGRFLGTSPEVTLPWPLTLTLPKEKKIMAMCKPDLVAAVLKQLGYEVPDATKLTKAVFAASAELKRQNGIDEKVCLLMTPVSSSFYRGSIRDKTSRKGGVKV